MAIEFAPEADTARNKSLQVGLIDGEGRVLYSSSGGVFRSAMIATSDPKTTGLWQFEVAHNSLSTDDIMVGVGTSADFPASGHIAQSGSDTVAFYAGQLWRNGASFEAAPAGFPISGNAVVVLTFIFNAATRKLWIKGDGTYLYNASGDPVAGTNEAATIGGTGALEPMFTINSINDGTLTLSLPNRIKYPVSGVTPFGYEARAVTIPTAESDKAFYTAGGVVLANAQIHYAIFAGAELDVEAAPIAKGSVTLNGSGLLPSLTIATDSTATAGRMVWHVDGTDPADFGGIRPVTLAAA